jgi:signal transduction histidine kinase
MDNRKILHAREKFVGNGSLPDAVRGIVAASWERSLGYQVPVERGETRLAPEEDLLQHHAENAELIQAAQPALDQARYLLAGASSMVILTDPSGFIIETAGDPRTIETARMIHLEQGGQWAEADIGTNAIGTAIAALQPVQIHGVEHFCSEVQRWTCAATPIWHPANGGFLGILDISGSAEIFNPQSLAFACAVGRQIESALAQAIKEERERLLRYSLERRSYWLTEDIVVIDRSGIIAYASGSALHIVERRHQGLIRNGRVLAIEKVPIVAWPARLNQLVPGVTTELVIDYDQAIGVILVVHRARRKTASIITAEEMRAAIARERAKSARQRTIELVKANQALHGCLDALASVPELDELLGQMMTAITRQLGAVSSVLRVRDFERDCWSINLVFQDGRVVSRGEAKYPQTLESIPLNEEQLKLLAQPVAVLQLHENVSAIPDEPRTYLLGIGVKTLLVVPLHIAKQLIGVLSFRFIEQREFRPEEIEITRALQSQAALAVHVTRLAKAAKQAAILEERTRLAGEIHDGLAQNFTAICMQLGVAEQELSSKEGDPGHRIHRALELANFGLAEARRCAGDLRLSTVEESGLGMALQRLVEHSTVAGALHCTFQASYIPEDNLPPRVKHELLRIGQEAVHNSVRHANPTVIAVTLEWHAPNLTLQIKDNGSGISKVRLEKSDGFGLTNMRQRASEIGGRFEIQTAPGRGTTVIVIVPVASTIRNPIDPAAQLASRNATDI